jgi:phytoene dehydrogenase-like protein
MNFLVHNMCRLPQADGTWLIVDGGMGTVTQLIAQEFLRAGGQIHTKKPVQELLVEGNAVKGVVCADGSEFKAAVVVCNADPFRMRGLIGANKLPAEYNKRIDGYERDGSTLKINLALRALPKFSCLPEGVGPGGATVHLLPEEDRVIASLKSAFADVQDGRLPAFPTIEWYVHTAVDPSLQDPEGRHSSALFVQWVPYEITGTTWADQEQRYVDHLLSICDRFAPGTSDLVVDRFVLNPQRIESHFGITRGHIHHVDNAFGFSDRLPYRTPIAGLYSCSAGCHPAGAVIGAAGHNAAACVIRDMEARLEMTELGRR